MRKFKSDEIKQIKEIAKEIVEGVIKEAIKKSKVSKKEDEK